MKRRRERQLQSDGQLVTVFVHMMFLMLFCDFTFLFLNHNPYILHFILFVGANTQNTIAHKYEVYFENIHTFFSRFGILSINQSEPLPTVSS